jgi:hypothetical protein
MSANRQASLVLAVNQDTDANGTETIKVSEFAPDGCTIHGIVVQTQEVDSSGLISITGAGNSLFNTAAPANQNQCVRTAGAQALGLTATQSHLTLASTAEIIIIRSGGSGTQSQIYFYYGDASPSVIPAPLT